MMNNNIWYEYIGGNWNVLMESKFIKNRSYRFNSCNCYNYTIGLLLHGLDTFLNSYSWKGEILL